MLSELRIRNFALIDELTVHLGSGLNVLTGETGAGKSIIVGALSLLLGERASSDVVRTGADRASIEGVFEIDGRPALATWLEERGIEADEGILILKREVATEGRNRAWVNGSPATASLLSEIGAALVSLHGQHQHQTLLRRDEQRVILDAFAGHEDLVREVAELHRRMSDVVRQIDTLEQRRREAMQRSDFLRFQAEEIEGAAIRLDEEESLDDESRRLSHAEELIELAGTVLREIGAGGDSASGRMSATRRPLEQLVRIDPSQGELTELFDTAYYAMEEIRSRLDDYLLVVEHDPARLEEIRQRQDLLYRLKSKYGPTLEDVAQTLDAARSELSLLDDAEWELSDLQRTRSEVERELFAAAGRLSRERSAAARALSAEVDRILPQLGMEGGHFEVAMLPLASPGSNGAEEVEFRVALNRGFEPRAIAQVASGGELSRVMLALKTILARLEEVPTLIFDEVDAGIGGRVGLHVGDKMREVAESHQVLAITHLPQIASRAHRHLLVHKDDSGRTTATHVVKLDSEHRVSEIARMLGGDAESEASLAHARELLARSGTESAPAA